MQGSSVSATKTNARFSKHFMLDALAERIRRMADDLGLDERNGYAQVMGKGEAWNRAYGEFCAYLDLHRDIDGGLIYENNHARNTRWGANRAAELAGEGDQGDWG